MHSVLPIRHFNDHTCNLILSHISSKPNPKKKVIAVVFLGQLVIVWLLPLSLLLLYCFDSGYGCFECSFLSVCYLFMVNLHTQAHPMLLLITFLYLFLSEIYWTQGTNGDERHSTHFDCNKQQSDRSNGKHMKMANKIQARNRTPFLPN